NPANAAFNSGSSLPASPPSRDSEMRRAAEAAAASGDWREALRNVDAAEAAAKPKASATKSSTPAPPKPAPDSLKIPAAAPASPPSGSPISIGSGGSGFDDLDSLEQIAKAVAACTR